MNFRFYRLIFCQCTTALANAALRFALSLHLYLVVCGKIYGTLARRYFPILVGKWRPGQPVLQRKNDTAHRFTEI
uniref:hypothetical protein n=1 Tax=Gemmiger formicilis TaxID=745368 RepID=UPI003FEF4DCA